jgi:hypothetical protein
MLPANLVLCDYECLESWLAIGNGHLEIWVAEGSSDTLDKDEGQVELGAVLSECLLELLDKRFSP